MSNVVEILAMVLSIMLVMALIVVVIAWLISPFLLVKYRPIQGVSKALSLVVAMCVIYTLGLIGIALYIILYIMCDKELNNTEKTPNKND